MPSSKLALQSGNLRNFLSRPDSHMRSLILKPQWWESSIWPSREYSWYLNLSPIIELYIFHQKRIKETDSTPICEVIDTYSKENSWCFNSVRILSILPSTKLGKWPMVTDYKTRIGHCSFLYSLWHHKNLTERELFRGFSKVTNRTELEESNVQTQLPCSVWFPPSRDVAAKDLWFLDLLASLEPIILHDWQ